jgi:hypothetical protein
MERHRAELRSQGYTVVRDAMSPQQLAAVREAFQLHNPDGERFGIHATSAVLHWIQLGGHTYQDCTFQIADLYAPDRSCFGAGAMSQVRTLASCSAVPA